MTTLEILESIRKRMQYSEPPCRRFISSKNRRVVPAKPWSIDRFAKHIGVHRATYHRWLKDEVCPMPAFVKVVMFKLKDEAVLMGDKVIVNKRSYNLRASRDAEAYQEILKEIEYEHSETIVEEGG